MRMMKVLGTVLCWLCRLLFWPVAAARGGIPSSRFCKFCGAESTVSSVEEIRLFCCG